jgi:hypothetical protein
MNKVMKEPKENRKERLRLSKAVTEKVIQGKKGYQRKPKHVKAVRED